MCSASFLWKQPQNKMWLCSLEGNHLSPFEKASLREWSMWSFISGSSSKLCSDGTAAERAQVNSQHGCTPLGLPTATSFWYSILPKNVGKIPPLFPMGNWGTKSTTKHLQEPNSSQLTPFESSQRSSAPLKKPQQKHLALKSALCRARTYSKPQVQTILLPLCVKAT